MSTKKVERISDNKIDAFRNDVWAYYKAHGRHDLPWRKTKDAYKILISEVMLQQTQVPRVLEKYKEFLTAFPTVRALSRAPLSDVLKVWSGMGYNRRAKFLREAAQVIVKHHKGKVPNDLVVLRKIPGIGPYTASAIRVFAYNEPDILIETNIRAAFIHHFFTHTHYRAGRPSNVYAINDGEITPIALKAIQNQDPREWHWALMDYGSHIKKLHKNPARKSAHYVRQSKFEGSIRQVRGAILRVLADGPRPEKAIYFLIRANKQVVESNIQKALEGLAKDRLIIKKEGRWGIA